jgi:acetyltransferase-like isoleucine patch superfamily enzyme
VTPQTEVEAPSTGGPAGPLQLGFHVLHRVWRVLSLAGYRLRRARWVLAVRYRAWWHRASLVLDVAPDVRLARGVHVLLEPHADVRLRIGRQCRVATGVHIHLRRGELVLGDGADVRPWCFFHVAGRVLLEGPNVLQQGCSIHCDDSVTISHHAGIGEYTTIVDSSHRPSNEESWFVHNIVTAPVEVGPHAWIGSKVTIGRGVHLGESCVVSANSLVVTDAPDSALVSGVPAKVVRVRREPEPERQRLASSPDRDPRQLVVEGVHAPRGSFDVEGGDGARPGVAEPGRQTVVS